MQRGIFRLASAPGGEVEYRSTRAINNLRCSPLTLSGLLTLKSSARTYNLTFTLPRQAALVLTRSGSIFVLLSEEGSNSNNGLETDSPVDPSGPDVTRLAPDQ